MRSRQSLRRGLDGVALKAVGNRCALMDPPDTSLRVCGLSCVRRPGVARRTAGIGRSSAVRPPGSNQLLPGIGRGPLIKPRRLTLKPPRRSSNAYHRRDLHRRARYQWPVDRRSPGGASGGEQAAGRRAGRWVRAARSRLSRHAKIDAGSRQARSDQADMPADGERFDPSLFVSRTEDDRALCWEC